MPAPRSRADAVQRLTTAQGHLAKVLAMTRDGVACTDTIFQLRAVRGALQQVEQALVEEHIRSCLAHGSHLPETVVNEILELWTYAPAAKPSRSRGRRGASRSATAAG